MPSLVAAAGVRAAQNSEAAPADAGPGREVSYNNHNFTVDQP